MAAALFSVFGDQRALNVLGSLLVAALLHHCSETISRALSAQEIGTLGNAKYLDLV